MTSGVFLTIWRCHCCNPNKIVFFRHWSIVKFLIEVFRLNFNEISAFHDTFLVFVYVSNICLDWLAAQLVNEATQPLLYCWSQFSQNTCIRIQIQPAFTISRLWAPFGIVDLTSDLTRARFLFTWCATWKWGHATSYARADIPKSKLQNSYQVLKHELKLPRKLGCHGQSHKKFRLFVSPCLILHRHTPGCKAGF